MPRHPRLQQRKSGYYLRAKVPEELVPQVGKREIVRSLGTKDHREALRLVRVESARVDQEFRNAEQTLHLKTELDEADIRRMVFVWFHENERLAALKYRQLRWDSEERKDAVHNLEIDASLYEDAQDEGTQQAVQPIVNEILAANHVELKSTDERYWVMYDLTQRAFVESLRRKHQKILGNHTVQTFDPLFREVSADFPLVAPGKEAPLTVRELIDKYRNDPSRQNLSRKAHDQYLVINRALQEILGENTPINSVTRADCDRVRETLAQLPPNATKRFPDLSIRQAVTHAKATGIAPIHPTTLNNYLNSLGALFKYAVRCGLLDVNPAASVRELAPKKRKKSSRDKFSAQQMNQIFSAPLYTGCMDDENGYATPGSKKPRRGRFWVPLLAIYTGMRLNECCQLRTEDIEKIDGVMAIHVRADDTHGTRVKNENAERTIPIHSQLVKIGFLKFVEARRKAKAEFLFPELPIDNQGYRSGNFSKWYGRYLTKVGAKSKRHTFHSFRHTFRAALRDARVPEEAQEALGGWEGSDSTRKVYGGAYNLATLKEEIEKIVYPGFDTNHLYPRG